MMEAMEETLYQHGVDAVFAGHVHAYESSYPVFRSSPLLTVAVPLHGLKSLCCPLSYNPLPAEQDAMRYVCPHICAYTERLLAFVVYSWSALSTPAALRLHEEVNVMLGSTEQAIAKADMPALCPGG